MTPSFYGEVSAESRQWVRNVISDDRGLEKVAANAVTEYQRIRLRETSFADRILPVIKVTDADLTPVAHSPKPYMLYDKEPWSPAAYTVPFGTAPRQSPIRAERIEVGFDRINTPRFIADVNDLRTYRGLDIRQVISDNSLKEVDTHRDGKFLQAINSMIDNPASIGTAGYTVPETGVIQHVGLSGGISKDTIVELKKIMTTTDRRLRPKTALINQTTAYDFEKFEYWEAGQIAEKLLIDGWAEQHWLGLDWIVTIKRDLVPDGTIYMFADHPFLGRNFVLDDVTMTIERKGYFLEWFCSMCAGMVIGNVGAVIRGDITD